MSLVLLRDEDFFEKHKEHKDSSCDIYISVFDENGDVLGKDAISKKKQFRMFFDDYESDITYQLGTDDTEIDESEIEPIYPDIASCMNLIDEFESASIFHVILK
jgi:hypothetical protein